MVGGSHVLLFRPERVAGDDLGDQRDVDAASAMPYVMTVAIGSLGQIPSPGERTIIGGPGRRGHQFSAKFGPQTGLPRD